MAKKIEKSTEKKHIGFGKISSIIDNISKKTAIMVDKSDTNQTFIDTGIYVFNALLSKSILKGGVSKNRITIFAGPPSCGKSYLCYNIARNAQKEGYNVMYIDTEFSIEKEELQKFGIDISDERFKLIRSNKVEDLKVFLTKLLDDIKKLKSEGEDVGKFLFILDSIGQLASAKEIEDALEGKNKADMSRAKAIKSLFRIINSDLGYLDIPLICTNHVYMCLTENHEILMNDDTYKYIQNIQIGDIIKTLDGDKSVVKTEKFEKCPIMEILLENGDVIKCTPNHKFLVDENWNNDENNKCWKSADELTENDIILSIEKE